MAYREMIFDRKTAKVARYHEQVKGGANGAPISLHVALCDACFNRCLMCDHPQRDPKVMDSVAWIEALRHFASMGVESVCYAGGDPMAYPKFNDVMSAHIALNVAFGMTITGYVPPTINYELLAHATWVRVSLDAVTPEVYEKVRGKTPVHKVLRSIEAMVAAGVKVGLGITVHAANAPDLDNVLAFAERLGISDVETHHIVPDSPRAIRADFWERTIEPFQHCHAVLYQLYIDASGDVYPCCITAGDAQSAPQSYNLGNVFTDDWSSIWNAVVAYSQLNYKDLPPICKTCCIQRLSQINSIVDQISTGQSFF